MWHFFEKSQPQLLYALLPDFTGNGYASEAAKEVVEYSFSKLGYERLMASGDAPSADSQRVLERLKMAKYKKRNDRRKPYRLL